MLDFKKAVNIYSEVDDIFNKGESKFLSDTQIYENHNISNFLNVLNSENIVYSNFYVNLQSLIKSLKVDGEEVIGMKKDRYYYEQFVNTERICELATPASFGKGTETVYDENVRKALEIPSSRIEIIGDENELYFSEIIPKNKKFVYKLYKMQIYKEGGKFTRHKDTIHAPNHYATLVVSLNSNKFKGGELVLYKNDSDEVLHSKSFNSYCDNGIIFLTDIDHEVKEITSGVRIVLQYDVYIEDNLEDNLEESEDEYDDSECLYYKKSDYLLCTENHIKDINNNISQKILNSFSEFVETHKDDEFCFLLRHKYPLSISQEYLKTGDLKLFEILSSVYDVKIGYIVNHFYSSYDGDYDHEEKRKLKVMNYSNVKRFINFINNNTDEVEEYNQKKVHTFLAGGNFNCVKSVDYIEHTGNEAAPAEYSYVSIVLTCNGKKLN